HSNRYLQCAKIFRNTKYSEELCAALAEKYKDDNIQLVIGPAMGAVQMAYEVSRNFDCENFFTERDENGKMQLRRGFAIEPGQRVLIVEDVVTTGGSVREVIELVKQNGGVVAGIGSIVDRTGGKIDFGAPFKAVYSADVQSWGKDECPICKEGKIELVKPGSRKIK
ncbi:MAG: orotate phosphoribosyltransferase, partial [Oscillospiraceae bacterium]